MSLNDLYFLLAEHSDSKNILKTSVVAILEHELHTHVTGNSPANIITFETLERLMFRGPILRDNEVHNE